MPYEFIKIFLCSFGAGRCVLTLRAAYAGEDGPGTVVRQEATIERGENRLPVSLPAPYCGLLSVTLTRLEVWDCFALFRAGKALDEKTEIAILPPAESLSITLTPWEEAAGPCLAERLGALPLEDHHEIRQLREYRIGDRDRFIHWNLTARTGELWVKEFESENQQPANLLLVWGEEIPSLPQWGSFFRLLSALLRGLLRQFPGVSVSWWGDGPQPTRVKVTGDAECKDLLLRLYRWTAGGELPRHSSTSGERQGRFVLDTGLGWYWEDTLLHRFSLEGLEQEIREKHFSL